MSVTNNAAAVLVLLWLGLMITACGETVPGLHERPRFSGEVELEWLGPDGARTGTSVGELAFDRTRDNFQWTVRSPAPTRSVAWLPAGGQNVFVDGVPSKEPHTALVTEFHRLRRAVGIGVEATERAVAHGDGSVVTYRAAGAEPAWSVLVRFRELEPPHGGR